MDFDREDEPFFVCHYGMERTVFHFHTGVNKVEVAGYKSWSDVKRDVREAKRKMQTEPGCGD